MRNWRNQLEPEHTHLELALWISYRYGYRYVYIALSYFGLTGETQTRPCYHLRILGARGRGGGGWRFSWVLEIPLLFLLRNQFRWLSSLSSHAVRYAMATIHDGDSLSITRRICLYLNLLLASGRRGQRISMATHQRNKCHICLYGPKVILRLVMGRTARAGRNLGAPSIDRCIPIFYLNIPIVWYDFWGFYSPFVTLVPPRTPYRLISRIT